VRLHAANASHPDGVGEQQHVEDRPGQPLRSRDHHADIGDAANAVADERAEAGAVAQEAALGSVERIVLTPPEFVTPEPLSDAGYILHPNLDAIRELGERIFESRAAAVP